MSLTLSYTTTEYAPLPAGNYMAKCVQIIDLGSQEGTKFGSDETVINAKIRIVWEIPAEVSTYTDAEGVEHAKPAFIGKKFTASLHEKSNLRQTLASWRGRDFTELELEGFNLANIIGKDCLINITHIKKEDKTYVNIAAVTPMMKGQKCNDSISKQFYFDLDKFDQEIWELLPDWLQTTIALSPEYKSLKGSVEAEGMPEINSGDLEGEIESAAINMGF